MASEDVYQLICQIGKGACGSVHLVRSKENKKLYALKKIELDESRKTRTKEAVLREARIMAALKHPHIVSYYYSFFDESEKYLCLIIDYCDGGTLDDKIKDAARAQVYLQEKQIIQWFLQISMAVRYMHTRKILHRDLKTENVFINKSAFICKLGDFGIAKSMDTTIDVASTCVGTPCYLSPEMCQDIPYSSKADVWALGCMLYEMLCLRPAFDAQNLVSLFYKIVKADFQPIPDVYSDDMRDLIETLLVKDPDERPSARGVLAIPFLREELLNYIEEKEFILEQRRLPTRDGSRPYSTPNLTRTNSERSTDQPPDLLPSQVQRAISSRPVLVTQRECSLLSSAKPGKHGRVSTIPEEESELLERSLRLQQEQLTIQLRRHKARLERREKARELLSREKSERIDEGEVLVSRKRSRDEGDHSHHSEEDGGSESDCGSSENRDSGHNSSSEGDEDTNEDKEPLTRSKSTELRRHVDRGQVQRSLSTRSLKKVDLEEFDAEVMRISLNKSPVLQKEEKCSSLTPEMSRRSRTPRYMEVDSNVNGAYSNSPDRGFNTPRMDGRKSAAMVHVDLSRKLKIQDPQRTPRIAPNNVLRLEMKPPSPREHTKRSEESRSPSPRKQETVQPQDCTPHREEKDSPPRKVDKHDSKSGHNSPSVTKEEEDTPRQSRNVDRSKSKKNSKNIKERTQNKKELKKKDSKTSILEGTVGAQRRDSRKTDNTIGKDKGLKGSKRGPQRTSETKESKSVSKRNSKSLKGDKAECHYYSDDFDETSDIEEDIPEEISASNSAKARSYSFTQTLEVPEIPEELDYLEDEDYKDDFETDTDDVVDEEIEQVVNAAHDALDSEGNTAAEDETIVDEHRARSSASRIIRKHCIDTFGREKYEKLKNYCENNDEPEIKKLEKMVGKENMKSFYLMNEMIISKKSKPNK